MRQVVVALKEAVDGRESDIILELLEDLEFLLQDLFLRVGVVCYIDEILDFWHVDFFVLASDQHGCHSDQLKLASRDMALLSVAVHQVDGDEQRLRLQLVLQVNFDQPRDEDCPHSIRQIGLVRILSTLCVRLQKHFRALHMRCAVPGDFSNVLWVVQHLDVALGH